MVGTDFPIMLRIDPVVKDSFYNSEGILRVSGGLLVNRVVNNITY